MGTFPHSLPTNSKWRRWGMLFVSCIVDFFVSSRTLLESRDRCSSVISCRYPNRKVHHHVCPIGTEANSRTCRVELGAGTRGADSSTRLLLLMCKLMTASASSSHHCVTLLPREWRFKLLCCARAYSRFGECLSTRSTFVIGLQVCLDDCCSCCSCHRCSCPCLLLPLLAAAAAAVAFAAARAAEVCEPYARGCRVREKGLCKHESLQKANRPGSSLHCTC